MSKVNSEMSALGIPLNYFTIVVGLAWAVAGLWIAGFPLALRAFASQKSLPPVSGDMLTGDNAPFTSVLVPARNESSRVLCECIRSILAQDYGRFEVISINDRSTDATGEILRGLAKDDARLTVLEGKEPPHGWLGKPYALKQALDHARGDWVLATDADVIFSPVALRTAMAQILTNELDALTLVPWFQSRSFWARVMTPAWEWLMLVICFLFRVGDPRSRLPVGLGGFFLVLRSALDHLGGYESLKAEATEDFRLAERLKGSGARLVLKFAPNLLRTSMYSKLGELREAHSKHMFAATNYSLPLALAHVAWGCVVFIAPPLIALACAVGLVVGDNSAFWSLFIPTFTVWLMQVFILVAMNKRDQIAAGYALTAPLGAILIYAILLDSSIRITMGRGITWKGRAVYSQPDVRPPRVSMKAFFCLSTAVTGIKARRMSKTD